MNARITRRTLLKGLGAAVALPWLEAMAPGLALAGPSPKGPRRMAFFYVPNGVNMPGWSPKELGAKFTLSPILEPLGPFKEDLLVLGGLTCDKARPNGDGPGDHARAMAAFLTGAQPRKTKGADIHAGISVDQAAAARIGRSTKFPSLEIGAEGGQQAGGCDSNYSCAYSANISWRTPYSPMVKEINPRALFDRLFSSGNENEDQAARFKRNLYHRSILDFVMEDANQLRKQLGMIDRRKLDEYLTSVRQIEFRLNRAEREVHSEGTAPLKSASPRPTGIPREYQDHLRLLCDLLALAFQGDLTRVATFAFANEGSNRSCRHINIPEGHHDLSHHGGNQEKAGKIQKINLFHMTQFAYFLDKLKSAREGDGTLLDNCMILYGSGNGDGNRHNHDDLPIVLAGKGGGTLRTGRHIRYPRETPLTNLYLSMLDRLDVTLDRFGDSTGRLTDL